MLEIIPFEQANIIGFRLDGRISDEEYHQAVAIIETALENSEKIRVYAEVERLGGMSLETFFENKLHDIDFVACHLCDSFFRLFGCCDLPGYRFGEPGHSVKHRRRVAAGRGDRWSGEEYARRPHLAFFNRFS